MANAKYLHFVGATTALITPNAGAVLHAVNIGVAAAATTSRVQIYDANATSATNATNMVGNVNASAVALSSYLYDAVMASGIVINVTDALTDVTIIFN